MRAVHKATRDKPRVHRQKISLETARVSHAERHQKPDRPLWTQRLHPLHHCGLKGHENRVCLHVAVFHDRNHTLLELLTVAVVLEFDVDPHTAATRLQHVTQRRHAFACESGVEAAANINCLHISQRGIPDLGVHASQLHEVTVVHDHHLSVGGLLHIDLHPVGMVGDCLFDGGQRVLRCQAPCPAVAHHFHVISKSHLLGSHSADRSHEQTANHQPGKHPPPRELHRPRHLERSVPMKGDRGSIARRKAMIGFGQEGRERRGGKKIHREPDGKPGNQRGPDRQHQAR